MVASGFRRRCVGYISESDSGKAYPVVHRPGNYAAWYSILSVLEQTRPALWM
ncbi:MAG: hypothetical protein QOJ42_3751 [Acidobacteriaceae bacterium]|jgi:hypothetical protein|nr:hypothetical protein [Acidobacteriaceae bacterium]